MSSTAIQNQDEFKDELVKRFFHPQSYFFLCLSTQLQDISAVACDVSEDDYLIIGQVMQHFVEAENPRKELARFAVIERYRDFLTSIDEVIDQLRRPGLQTEDMKKLIESAANDFVEVLVDIIHDEQSRAELLRLAGVELPRAQEPTPLPEEPAHSEDGSGHTLELDPSLTELNETILEETRSLEESFTFTEDEESEPLDALPDMFEPAAEEAEEPALDEMPAFSDELLEPEAGSALLPDKGSPGIEDENTPQEQRPVEPLQEAAPPLKKDVSDEPLQAVPQEKDEKEAMPAEEEALPELPQWERAEAGLHAGEAAEQESLREPVAGENPAEPMNLSRGFCDEAEKMIAEIRSTMDQLAVGRQNQKTLKKLRGLFLDLRESAMIHGFQLTEELAGKVQRLAERLLQTGLPLPEPVYGLLIGLPDLLAASLAEDYSDTLGETARTVIGQIVQATLSPQEFSPPAEPEPPLSERKVTEQTLPQNNGRIDEPEVMPEFEPPEPESRPTAEPLPEIPQSFELDDEGEVSDDDLSLPLPGENDPELLALIQEVSQHSAKKTANPAHEQRKPAAAPTPAGSQPESSEGVLAWRAESELYFRVINESLDKLSDNPTDRLALENLELASYSMKGLARKLDLDHFALFPELVEELVSKVLLLHLPCPANPAEVIRKGFRLLRDAADINKEAPELRGLEKEMRRFIQSLDDFMPRDEAPPETQRDENVVVQRQRNFKLKGRETPAQQPASQPDPTAANKLDYLMNKDLGNSDDFE